MFDYIFAFLTHLFFTLRWVPTASADKVKDLFWQNVHFVAAQLLFLTMLSNLEYFFSFDTDPSVLPVLTLTAMEC